jgi:hypothetical protein
VLYIGPDRLVLLYPQGYERMPCTGARQLAPISAVSREIGGLVNQVVVRRPGSRGCLAGWAGSFRAPPGTTVRNRASEIANEAR